MAFLSDKASEAVENIGTMCQVMGSGNPVEKAGAVRHELDLLLGRDRDAQNSIRMNNQSTVGAAAN